MYQEVSFAPSIVVQCGGHITTLNALACMASFLRTTGLEGSFFSNMDSGNETASKPWAKAEIFSQLREKCGDIGSKSWTRNWAKVATVPTSQFVSYYFFLYALRSLRTAGATDQRDKVFVALGFLSRSLPVETRSKLIPGYDASIESAYVRAASILQEELPDLAVMSEVEDPSIRELKDLPSWVPDFTIMIESLLGTASLSQYNATNCSRNKRLQGEAMKINNNQLTLNRVCIDVIDDLQEQIPQVGNATDLDAVMLCFTKLLRSWALLINEVGRGSCKVSPLEAFWKTVVAGCTKRNGGPGLSN